jgi:light-regulated signal transduction histidine kinase (bacteriophytochrome)
MQDAAVRMKNLIQHLLRLSRVKTRGDDFRPVQPLHVINTVLDDLNASIDEWDGTVNVGESLPAVMADTTQLGQLFQNLVSNALKFRSPDRAPAIEIDGEVQGDQVVFRVADNGIGIKEDYQEKIFGPFQRLHRREDYEGDGVGLALCEKIVRRHGGKIWVDSTPGKGSAFYFTMPTVAEGANT